MGLFVHILFIWILWWVTRSSTNGLESVYHEVSPFYPASALSAAYVFLYGFRRSWILYVLKLLYWYVVALDFGYFLASAPQSIIATTGAVCLGLLLRVTLQRWRTLSLPAVVVRSIFALLIIPAIFGVLYNTYALWIGDLKPDQFLPAIANFAIGDGASNTSFVGVYVLIFAFAHLAFEKRFAGTPPIFGGDGFATRLVEQAKDAALKIFPYVAAVAVITFFIYQTPSETVRNRWYLVIPPVILAVVRGGLVGAMMMSATVSVFLVFGTRWSGGGAVVYTVFELQIFLICLNALILVMGAFAADNSARVEALSIKQRELEVADTAKLRILAGVGAVLLQPIQSVLEYAKNLKSSEEVSVAAHQALGVLEQLLEYNDLGQAEAEPSSPVPLQASVYRALVRAQKLNVGGPVLPELSFSIDPKLTVQTSPMAFSSLLDHFFSVGLRMRRLPTSPWRVNVDVKDGRARILMCLSEIKDEIDLTMLGAIAAKTPLDNSNHGLPGGYLLSLLMVRRMATMLNGNMELIPHLLKHGIDVRIEIGPETKV